MVHPHLLDKVPMEDRKQYETDFEIITSVQPLEIVKDVFFLGQIPRQTKFEKGGYKDDAMLDDSAIAIRSKDGVIVLTGCSHSGICNICEYAKKITNQKLFSVIGGFHLFEDDPIAIEGTMDYFRKEKPARLYPMHCVDFPILARFHSEFKINKLGTGDVIEY